MEFPQRGTLVEVSIAGGQSDFSLTFLESRKVYDPQTRRH